VVSIYAAAFIATFNELYDSVQIYSIALVGLCGWLYGTRIGLFSILPFVLLNTAILYLVSGEPCDVLLTYNPVGIIIAMSAVLGTGSMRESQDKLNKLRDNLDYRVDEATAELDELAQRLIENDEQDRIRIGQDLHDGVGQYLTCMLLHSEALSLRLREAGRVEADLAEWMTRRVQKNIRTVRQLSRSLLPIQFTETSLETALDAMVAYFNDASSAKIKLNFRGNSEDIPIPTAQHLYRIAHETVYCAIYKHKATSLDIKLITGRSNCQTRIKGRTPRKTSCSSGLISEVMKYRIKAIGGKQTCVALAKSGFRMKCSADYREGSRMIQTDDMATRGKQVMERHRFAFLAAAWLAYMVFTSAGHPFFGVSVMLPSILLCGFATWLYGYKTGLLTSSLKERIRQRNENLKEITKHMVTQSEAERSRMSETLCDIVACQQTGLFYHSEALMNFLVYGNAPQADAAIKLVQIAKENMEQVKNITKTLSPQKIVESGIKQALHEMCAYFTETTNTDFTISISDHLGRIPEKTSLNIYRIAHEAVNNALRHGKATHIDLALKLAKETCTLEVVNNGNPLPSTPCEGLGMRLIQQRGDTINATTRLESTSEGQTRFECTVPLHDSSL